MSHDLASIKRLLLEFLPDFDMRRLGLFEQYLDALLLARKSFNLIGTDDPAVIIEDHLADSLLVLPEVAALQPKRVIDIGSGAGLPGIPLAIVLPYVQFSLVDSRTNRAEFLAKVKADLPLPNVEVHMSRAEKLAREPQHRKAYGVALARGTAVLGELVELTLPFLRVGGVLCAHKGRNPEAEVAAAKNAIETVGGGCASIRETGSSRGTTIITVPKIAPTPEKYPRKSGQPHKRPL